MGDLAEQSAGGNYLFVMNKETESREFKIASDEVALTSHNGGRSSATPSQAAM
jgi:hypothetical protein